MAEVIVNIKANTGQATAEVDDLNNSLNNTTDSADELSASLAKQEARIKTLDGAINLIGGSVELLAGGLALTGALSEEQAEKFQTAAIGAIAFADGTKRVLDGYKSLNEGLANYGGVAGVATKATKALNAAVLANPWVAAAAAVAVVTVAITAYVISTDDAEEAERNLAATRARNLAGEAKYLDLQIRLMQARKEDAISIKEQQVALLNLQIAQKEEAINASDDWDEQKVFYEERDKLVADEKVAREELKTLRLEAEEAEAKANQESIDKQKEANIKAADDRKKQLDENLKAEQKFFDDVFKAQEDLTNKQKAEFEKRKSDRQAIADYEHDLLMEEFNESITVMKKKGEARDEDDAKQKASIEEQRAAVSASLTAFSNLAQSLADVQDETSKEGFEAGKKYKIAQVITSAMQSAFEAYAGAQKFNTVVPGLGTAIGVASVAAIALASKKAISDIQNAQFGGAGANISVPSAGGAGMNVPNLNAQFGQGGFLAPGAAGGTPSLAPAEPIQAYVLASDVTTGVQAYGQISRRRRLGG